MDFDWLKRPLKKVLLNNKHLHISERYLISATQRIYKLHQIILV